MAAMLVVPIIWSVFISGCIYNPKIDPANFKPFTSLPRSLQAKLKGRPKALVTKERITIRLSPDVVQTFRSSGDGWQTRIDAALKEWLQTHKVA